MWPPSMIKCFTPCLYLVPSPPVHMYISFWRVYLWVTRSHARKLSWHEFFSPRKHKNQRFCQDNYMLFVFLRCKTNEIRAKQTKDYFLIFTSAATLNCKEVCTKLTGSAGLTTRIGTNLILSLALYCYLICEYLK